jgi:hypothetical protein
LTFSRITSRMRPYGSGWHWDMWRWSRGQGVVGAPIWLFAVALSAGGVLMVVNGRRARRAPSACVACGYDLRGLGPGAVCPECGGKTT